MSADEQWVLGEKGPMPVHSGHGEWVEIDVIGDHGGFAMVVWRMEDDERSPKCEARARLIAAAPDLLAVAQKIKTHGTISSTWYDELEAAINKATGAKP